MNDFEVQYWMIDPNEFRPARLFRVAPGHGEREWVEGVGWSISRRTHLEIIGGSTNWSRISRVEAIQLIGTYGGTESDLDDLEDVT